MDCMVLDADIKALVAVNRLSVFLSVLYRLGQKLDCFKRSPVHDDVERCFIDQTVPFFTGVLTVPCHI